MCFFPRNGATLNDSLFLYLYTKAFHFQKVENYLVVLGTSTKWKLIQKETGNCGKLFSTKVEIIVIFLFPQNGKCYSGKFLIHKVFHDLYYFERMENTRGRNLKMCLFPQRGKKSSYFLYFCIYLFQFSRSGKYFTISMKRKKIQWFISLPKSKEH